MAERQAIKAEETWRFATAANPDTTTSQPKLGIQQAEGMLGDARLALILQPGRLDWLYVTAFDPDLGDAVHEKLQPYSPALRAFTALLTPWLPTSPPAHRVALGTVLRQPVDSLQAGYTRLQYYLPSVQLDPINSGDFLYQINRPRRSSSIVDLNINRLSKWGVAQNKYSRLDIATGALQMAHVSETLYVRGEFDVNTSAEYGAGFDAGQMQNLFGELAQLTTELALAGDIP